MRLCMLVPLLLCAAGQDGKWPPDVPKETPVVYYLPFPAGKQYPIMDSPHGALQNKYAVDFTMPMRSAVCASADGVVIKAEEDGPDTGGKQNSLILRHADGMVTCYLHLAHDGVVPEVGDFVYRGDVVAWSGASGTGVPHTHFSLNKEKMLECVPVTFHENSGRKKWVSQNESFSIKYASVLDTYRAAENGIAWGTKFRFWSRALAARGSLEKVKPKESDPARLRRRYVKVQARLERLDADIEAFLEEAEGSLEITRIALAELKGTPHIRKLQALEAAFKKSPDYRNRVRDLRATESRRSALKRAFEKDLKGGHPRSVRKGYESFLKRYKDAPEAPLVRERLAALPP